MVLYKGAHGMKIPYKELKSRIVKKEESDRRRHKKHCIYFFEEECTIKCDKCYGSSNCLNYKSIHSNLKNSMLSSEKNIEKIETGKEKRIQKNRNCTLVLHIDKLKKNQIESILYKKGCYDLKITLRNAERLISSLDKITFTRIVIEYDDIYKKCWITNNNIQIIVEKNKFISIIAKVMGLTDSNTTISSKSYSIWQELDPVMGNVEILVNPKWKNKKKKNKHNL